MPLLQDIGAGPQEVWTAYVCFVIARALGDVAVSPITAVMKCSIERVVLVQTLLTAAATCQSPLSTFLSRARYFSVWNCQSIMEWGMQQLTKLFTHS